ncbi:MAG: Fic family protein [Candidatus Babeliales bacterium]|nr:Fic family protein [Candidatus Babeliales bacterium]
MNKLFLNIFLLVNFNLFCTPDLEFSKQEQLDIIKKEVIRNPKYGYSNLEVANLIKALELIKTLNLVNKSKKEITVQTILDLHKLILKDIDNENAGKLRTTTVSIDNNSYIFPQSYELKAKLDEFIKWLHETTGDSVKVAIDAHLKFVNIHPFLDGNGRTAKLLLNILLIQAGYVPFLLDLEKRDAFFVTIKKAQVENDLADYYDFFLKN